MRVLVTGASGLVGGRVVAALLADGVAVRAASRAVRAWPADVEGVVTAPDTPATLAAACRDVDAVVNLAAMPEAECAANPSEALRANVGGTLGLVAAAVAASVARFVQLSTAKVYGNNAWGTVTEASPTRPTSHYAITHRASEDYAALHPAAVVLRLANGFGAPADGTAGGWDVIANDFCRQAATARRIVIQSDGMAWRNFTPMGDVVAAIRGAMERIPPGTYNLGRRDATTLRAMAELVAATSERVLGYPIDVCTGAAGAPIAVPLDFRSDRLRDAGVPLDADPVEEIARTLIAARERYSVRVDD